MKLTQVNREQPSVLGEIVAGILLGPSVLGQIPGNIPLLLFPKEIRIFLNVCAQLGLIIFMFVVGLEVDISALANSSTQALIIGGMSVVLPFVIGGFVLSPYLYSKYQVITCVAGNTTSENVCTPTTDQPTFNLFIGVAMSVTAFPVLARIITDYKMIRLPVGSLVMACAALNDLIAWILLAVCLAFKHASDGYAGVITMAFASVGYYLALTHILNPLLRLMVVRQYRLTGAVGPGTMAFILINLLVTSWFLHYLGFHAMLGAFMFGLAFPRSGDSGIFHMLLEKLETVSVLLLLPCFFLVTGLSIDVSTLGSKGAMDLLYVCIVAVFGKIIGSGIPAYLLKLGPRKSATIGVLMNTRGLAEIVILNIGLQQQILNQDLFTIMVMMAIITTIMAGPLLRIVYPSALREKDLLELDESLLLRRGDIESEETSILVALVHNVSNAYDIVSAGLENLNLAEGPGVKGTKHPRPVQLVLLNFCERHGEIGTGLQETVAEVEQRHALDNCLATLEAEGRVLHGGLVMIRVKGQGGSHVNGDLRNIVHCLLPRLLVVDWPADAGDQEHLKQAVLTATCPILLYSGRSSDSFAPDPSPTPGSVRRSLSTDHLVMQAEGRRHGWLQGAVGPIASGLFALREAVDDEFGGASLACCLGLGSAANSPDDCEAAATSTSKPADARDRVDNLRNNPDLLAPAAQGAAADGANGTAGQHHGTGVVTLMIAGLGGQRAPAPAAAGPGDAGAAAAVQVDDIFRTLGVNGRGVKSDIGTSRRVFAPILINPPPAAGVSPMVTAMPSPSGAGGLGGGWRLAADDAAPAARGAVHAHAV